MPCRLYFKGAEYNVPCSRYLQDTVHGRSQVKSARANGFYELVCNSAGERPASQFEKRSRTFPGWVGIISPRGRVPGFVEEAGNDQAMVVCQLAPQELADRRAHPDFPAKELNPALYRFK